MEIRDINMLFANTVVQLSKEKLWYYVNNVSEDLTALCTDLETQKIKRIKFDENTWKAPSARLGYVNVGDVCVYISRHAYRKYKQGLAKECCEITNGDMYLDVGDREAVFNTMNILGTESFFNCLKGEYPTFQEAVALVVQGSKAVAFDRQFAVDADLNVYYKGKMAGKVTEDKSGIQFKKKLQFLQRVVSCL